MSSATDNYESYNYDKDLDKSLFCGHSGKQRTKKEAQEHSNHFDPSGQTRKLVTKMQNTETNKRKDRKPSQ